MPRWVQPIDATLSANFSAGVWYIKVFLGRSLSCLAMALSWAWLKIDRKPTGSYRAEKLPISNRPVAVIRAYRHDCRMSRADFLKTATPQLIAKVRMYEATEGGRAGPAYSGWGCPCMVSRMEPLIGYDALPLIGDEPLLPGETRQLGFVFLAHEQAVPIMRTAGRFYLWERGFVGEAVVEG